MPVKILITSLALIPFFAFGQNPCEQHVKSLKAATTLNSVSGEALKKLDENARFLEQHKCTEFSDGNEECTLTELFGQVCLNANSEQGTGMYIDYLKRNSGSAEEARGSCFELLFRQNPERILPYLERDSTLVPLLVWGFLRAVWVDHQELQQSVPAEHWEQMIRDPHHRIFYSLYPVLKSSSRHDSIKADILIQLNNELMNRMISCRH